MHNKVHQQPALLANLAGAHLPPVVLNIPADFQYCVDAGVCHAASFFDEITTCGLHDHIALSTHVFITQIKHELAKQGDVRPFNHQLFIDAFVAGYLGRIQQELRLFHGENAHLKSREQNTGYKEGKTWHHH